MGFVLECIGEPVSAVSAAVATALPLGILMMVWYRGNLERAGLWMIIRILAVNLVPVAFFLMGLLEKTPWIILQEVITIGVELIYILALRKPLVGPYSFEPEKNRE